MTQTHRTSNGRDYTSTTDGTGASVPPSSVTAPHSGTAAQESSPGVPEGSPADAGHPHSDQGRDGRRDDRSVSVSARLGRLQFHKSGKFRVLQLADIQDGPKVSPDTIRLIAAACDAARPDLVILSGNQIAGYDGAYAKTYRKRRWGNAFPTGNVPASSESDAGASRRTVITPAAIEEHQRNLRTAHELVRQSAAQFLAPLIERGIPFAVTYGNHDFQCGLDTAEMDAIFREFPGCLNPEVRGAALGADDAADAGESPEGALEPTLAASDALVAGPVAVPVSGLKDQQAYPCEPGTFALPVSDVDRTRNVIGIVLVDSGDYARSGGYGAPTARALNWMEHVPSALGTESIVFQHMPIPQFYGLLKSVPATTAYAIQGYRTFDRQCYVLDPDRTQPGGTLGEGVSCPDVDCGEFDIMKGDGGYFALFAGHDHRNAFVGTNDGIMLGATPTCGFGSYGPPAPKRAIRMFEFDIRHPFNPRSQLLEFGELVGKPISRPVYTFAMSYTPRDAADTTNLLRKPGALAGIIAGAAGIAGVAGLGVAAAFGHRRR